MLQIAEVYHRHLVLQGLFEMNHVNNGKKRRDVDIRI